MSHLLEDWEALNRSHSIHVLLETNSLPHYFAVKSCVTFKLLNCSRRIISCSVGQEKQHDPITRSLIAFSQPISVPEWLLEVGTMAHILDAAHQGNTGGFVLDHYSGDVVVSDDRDSGRAATCSTTLNAHKCLDFLGQILPICCWSLATHCSTAVQHQNEMSSTGGYHFGGVS